jgi:hypothetical protein
LYSLSKLIDIHVSVSNSHLSDVKDRQFCPINALTNREISTKNFYVLTKLNINDRSHFCDRTHKTLQVDV